MDVMPFVKKENKIIESYFEGGFRIGSQRYEVPVIVRPECVAEWDTARPVLELNLDCFSQILDNANEIDVVLLGTGKKLVFLDTALKKALGDRGLLIEVMGTPAACRTYNVLMAEGRRVLAALLPV